MLRITYEVDRDSYMAKMIALAAHKVEARDIASYSKTYSDFVDELNKLLKDAFEVGRSFERSYKPEEE